LVLSERVCLSFLMVSVQPYNPVQDDQSDFAQGVISSECGCGWSGILDSIERVHRSYERGTSVRSSTGLFSALILPRIDSAIR